MPLPIAFDTYSKDNCRQNAEQKIKTPNDSHWQLEIVESSYHSIEINSLWLSCVRSSDRISEFRIRNEATASRIIVTFPSTVTWVAANACIVRASSAQRAQWEHVTASRKHNQDHYSYPCATEIRYFFSLFSSPLSQLVFAISRRPKHQIESYPFLIELSSWRIRRSSVVGIDLSWHIIGPCVPALWII